MFKFRSFRALRIFGKQSWAPLRGRSLTSFFRNSAVLFLVLFSTGCTEIDQHCQGGAILGAYWLPSWFPEWLFLSTQTGLVWFVLISVSGIFLYRTQLNLRKNWSLRNSENLSPSLPSWSIPLIFGVLLFLPIVWFLIIVQLAGGYCSFLQTLFSILGAWAGSILGWWLAFQFYYRKKIRQLFNP